MLGCRRGCGARLYRRPVPMPGCSLSPDGTIGIANARSNAHSASRLSTSVHAPLDTCLAAGEAVHGCTCRCSPSCGAVSTLSVDAWDHPARYSERVTRSQAHGGHPGGSSHVEVAHRQSSVFVTRLRAPPGSKSTPDHSHHLPEPVGAPRDRLGIIPGFRDEPLHLTEH